MKQLRIHHSISICEVKLKILMETLELQGRLPVWRNKLCGPCSLLCCACFFPFFQLLSMTLHQYDKWLCKTVHDLWWFDQYGQNNQLIVNFILCQGNLNFCSEKFLEPWYNLSSETEVMLWKPELLGNRKITSPKTTTKKLAKKYSVHSITQDCAEIDLDLKIVVLTLCL